MKTNSKSEFVKINNEILSVNKVKYMEKENAESHSPLVVYDNEKFTLDSAEYNALEVAILENTILTPIKTSKRLFFTKDIMYLEENNTENGVVYNISLKDYFFVADEAEYKEIISQLSYKEYSVEQINFEVAAEQFLDDSKETEKESGKDTKNG